MILLGIIAGFYTVLALMWLTGKCFQALDRSTPVKKPWSPKRLHRPANSGLFWNVLDLKHPKLQRVAEVQKLHNMKPENPLLN